MTINTNWYVITGGPSSGITDTCYHIAFLGYPVVSEAARVLINDEKSRGKPPKETRANEAVFQRKLLRMKIEAEERIQSDALTFFERGIPDSIAYYQICGEDITPAIEASRKRRYKGVFLLELLKKYEKDYARKESKKERFILQKLLHECYSDLGYGVVLVPEMPISERAQFILSKV